VREGNGVTVYTVGYERRLLPELIQVLRDIGVELLVDVRENPFSRRPDFRSSSLAAACTTAGLRYESWTELGSTEAQRTKLIETHDYSEFRRRFRKFASTRRKSALDRLADVANKQTVALLCYERSHDECHRSVVADLVAKRLDASVAAIT
jgi:uncharacterized protein (DUF488 family)